MRCATPSALEVLDATLQKCKKLRKFLHAKIKDFGEERGTIQQFVDLP